MKNIIKTWLKDHDISLPDERIDILITMLKSRENDIRQQERERIAEELVKIEREKWKDAKHCSCLGYAIVKVFGEKYEDRFTSIKTLNQ